MELIYAPWRGKYLREKDSPNCPFCEKFSRNEDEKHFILKRLKHCVILLNLHPYNAGHLLIIPYSHVKELYKLSPDEQSEIMLASSLSMEILKEQLKCEGINLGLNVGKISGGSVPNHLHMHILPRWEGDTNFLAALADTKPISFDMADIYKKLLPFFESLKIG